jgi:hypothetical protein
MTDQTHDANVKLDQQVRYSIFRHFMTSGRAPSALDTAAALGLELRTLQESLRRLEVGHAIVLAPGSLNIWMCHPFSAVPTPFRVRTAGGDYWGNCAWDMLGISALLRRDSRTEVLCPDCAERLTVTIKDGTLVETEGVVHYAVPPRHFWDNVAFT